MAADYKKGQDYCGPEDSWISKLVPDRIYGVNIAECCYQHDEDYRDGGGEAERKGADRRFHHCIKCKLKKGLFFLFRIPATIRAFFYWRAVRRLGKGCFKYKVH